MSLYAYRNLDKTDEINIDDLYNEPADKIYYCPDQDCPAWLKSVMRYGVKKPYFRALPSHPHRKNCPYTKNNADFVSQYDENLFDFHRILNRIMTDSSSNKLHGAYAKVPTHLNSTPSASKTPKTICELYTLLKQLSPSSNYGEMPVSHMLFDERSAYLYTKYVQGEKLIECYPSKKYYDEQKGEFYLESKPEKNRFNLVLSCKDKKIFRQIRDYLFNNNDRSFVIAANWRTVHEAKHPTAKSLINSKKQIYLIKNGNY